jgi:hypothetical protein
VPASNRGLVELHVEAKELQTLFFQLKAMEGSLQVELRRGIREAAAPMVAAVKANASWSSRIPGAVSAKPSFTAKRAGVTIQVNAKAAPEARPLENQGKGGTFRHPVYGHRNNWVDQAARPFFFSAVERTTQAEIAMRAVMVRVAAKAGL